VFYIRESLGSESFKNSCIFKGLGFRVYASQSSKHSFQIPVSRLTFGVDFGIGSGSVWGRFGGVGRPGIAKERGVQEPFVFNRNSGRPAIAKERAVQGLFSFVERTAGRPGRPCWPTSWPAPVGHCCEREKAPMYPRI
jgi:hypothetical protein